MSVGILKLQDFSNLKWSFIKETNIGHKYQEIILLYPTTMINIINETNY